MSDETVTNDSERVGFCQDCGRPLTRETVRPVGSGVFCEPCLEVRLGTATPPYGAGVPVGGAVPPPVAPFQEPFAPIGGDNPSPGWAAALGLIPGVGAMYNGQFAKGIAHIVIFALLQSMTHVSDIFGVLVMGWVFYQSFEAYHTAKARREGLPLPDPFGLNNIGAHVNSHFRGTAAGAPPAPRPPAPPYASSAYTSSPYTSSPYAGWPGTVPPQAVVTPPPVPPVAEPQAQAWESVPPVAESPVQNWPDAPAYVPPPTSYASRFPSAAVWLIGFGFVFLVLNVVPEWRFGIHRIIPLFLMALGVGIFIRRMSSTGGVSPAPDEGEAYTTRAVYSMRAPVVLFTLGVLWSLQEFDVIRFGRTWPVLVIVIGVLLLIERSLGSKAVPLAPVAGPADVSAVDGNGKGL